MDAEAGLSSIAPPVFDGDNYQIWAVRMETYLDALDLWEAVEEDYEIPALPANPTMAHIKAHKEKKTKKSKAKACLFAAISATIFLELCLSRRQRRYGIFSSQYEGDEKIRGIEVLNLIRDFEMRENEGNETIKEYANRTSRDSQSSSILGSSLTDSRIVEKFL
ncbi:uncharacterized protein LOC130136570 [Syzygium oleosum]|uniref:uncharacterized protein LOC130136570 n=1 Tax=Syzygium oleosum TaxID=219896 RepID=UPI0024B9C11B|nr:uncharacterized protein LOC130136570 [Syzygium oleosum]